MSLKHDHLLNPVTALEFHQRETGALLILAGEGSFLKIFDANESRLLHQCEIFKGQAIHGVAVRDEMIGHELGLQVVIWGGSNLALLTKQKFDLILDQNVDSITDTAVPVSDWILDVAISPFDGVGCVLVTAHNTVIQASLGRSDHTPLLETLHSPSRSILYSAHLFWESPSCVLIAAGTVFGEIIVWQCSASSEIASSASRVLFTFTGHEGSVFGVNISPPITGLDNVNRLLASCSDDRTIRVWNLSADSNCSQATPIAMLVRETGFGGNGVRSESPKTENTYMAMVMGHASRIWRVRFLGDQSSPLESSAINILSFGEDSTTQQWALDFETSSTDTAVRPRISASLNQLDTFAFHSGKHIWSTAVRRIDNSKAIVASGGADGKITSYESRISSYKADFESPLSNDVDRPSFDVYSALNGLPWSSAWELDEILKSSGLKDIVQDAVSHQPDLKLSHKSSLQLYDGKPTQKIKGKKIPKDALNRYAFVSENEVLVTTTFGRVLLCYIGPHVQWDGIALPESGPEDLKSYAVVVGFPEIGLACLAGANGSIYVYHRCQRFLKLGNVEGKVADMFKIYETRTKSFELLVTTLGGMSATLFSFDVSRHGVRLVENTALLLPEKFFVTSAGRNNNLLIMGSRSGTLALYVATRPERPLEIWTPPGGTIRDAITSVTIVPTYDALENRGLEYFLATSRDGSYSIFSTTVVRNSNITVTSVKMQRVHQGTPPFGPMIEAGWFEVGKLILCGFKGKNFVVWNETDQYEVTNVECGGSHRSYAYSPVRGSTGGYFVYTKASKMHIHSHQASSHRVIKPGGHGREIKTCAVSEDQNLIATGAEDTAIRIWQYNKVSNPESQLSCKAIMQKHSAGIQHIQWHGSSNLFSSGGNEEFFIWAVEQIPGFGIGVICEATCPDPSEERDLRVMNFDVTELSNSSSCLARPYLVISLAYSDSTIRTYTYSKPESFRLVATGKYTSCCLTQIRHISVQDNEIVSLTAGTDGKLALWKMSFNEGTRNSVPGPVKMVLLSTQKIHQNTIKSLDMVRLKNHVLVATGGDDNALGISLYPVSGNVAAITPTRSILRASHATAITGLCFVHDPDIEDRDKSTMLVSSGNDQKVKAWAVRIGKDYEKNFALNIKKIGNVFTPVADVGDVAAFKASSSPGKVLIVGNGIEVWKIPELEGGMT